MINIQLTNLSTFTDFVILAAYAHRGVCDKGGVEYIKHPLHVAHTLKLRGGSEEAQMAAIAHDVIEDTKGTPTEITIEQIEAMHAPTSVVKALRLLTHIKNIEFIEKRTAENIADGMNPKIARIIAKEEEYFNYVIALSKDDIARAVKIADLDHNRDLSRVTDDDLIDWKSREYIGRKNIKYAKARRILTGGRVGY
jgi:(p)ppGpp synthase/HD superfamily hydrolase